MTTPFSGIFVIRMLAIATNTISLSTKFEFSNSTRYNDTKGDTKYRK